MKFFERLTVSRCLAWVWMLVVAAIALHQWNFWHAPRLDTDVFSLLPVDEQAPVAQRAMRQLGEQGERRIVVMVGASDWAVVQSAADEFDQSLRAAHAGLRRVADSATAGQTMDFYQPWRDALLTDQQRTALQQAKPQAMAQQALARLHGLSTGQPTAWMADPLGLWSSWWSQRAGLTAARPRDGLLWVADTVGHREWAVLLYETEGSAFRLDGNRRWGDALDQAGRAAQQGVGAAALQVLMAGVPLHAEAGAVQGNREMNTIGWGSLAAVVALVWWAFWAMRPVVLIALSLLVGCAAGLSVTVWVFGQVHLLTLVFGASLVGVAEDFGIHYFASRLSMPKTERWALMTHLLPGLSLALLTSVLGYLVLAIVPFPGLRQMALFSAVGLVAAFLTAVCWFPVFDRGALPGSGMERAVAGSLADWPRLRGRALAITLVIFGVLCAWGISRLHVNDDLRQLQSSPPALIQAQLEVGRLLRMPSPAQFFMVQGPDAQTVLQREEALKAQLAPWLEKAARKGEPLSLNAVSDWVPSHLRQADNRALTGRVETAVLQQVGQVLGEDLSRPTFSPAPIELTRWLSSPVSTGLRAQWLGQVDGAYASVVLIGGLSHRAQADELRGLGEQLDGVRWVDRTTDLSRLLGRFRTTMAWLLVLGHGLVWAALALRFGRSAWRAWLPTALASLGCLAVQGWLGEPFQLFNLLALMLLLGMGVDYGIFLLEHPGEGQGHAWLAVLLGAISTGLSFGLLALSATPALHAFGLTLLVGLTLVCILAPSLRLQNTDSVRGST
ncbi:MAG: hypothetical protein V4532_14850 [Pseudomonadota bacterium]